MRKTISIVQAILILILFALPLLATNFPKDIQRIERQSRRGDFHFIVIGDRTGAGPESWAIFDHGLRKAISEKPAFIIFIGDIIQGGSSVPLQTQWQEAKERLDSLDIPFFMVPGNHDIFSPQSASYWKDVIGATWFSFNFNDYHFLFLSTEERAGTGKAGFGEDQLAFIQNDLMRLEPGASVIIFLHQPVWLYDEQLKEEWKMINAWVGEHSMTAIAGHFHVLAEKKKQNRRLLMVGPTGGRMRMGYNPELGLMHHLTKVACMPDSLSITFLESNREYPEDLALKAYQRYLKSLLLLKGSAKINAEMQ